MEKGFILGVEGYPEWFRKLDQDGRVAYETNPITGALEKVHVANKLVTVEAFSGDTLFFIGKNVVVCPKDKAKQYNINK